MGLISIHLRLGDIIKEFRRWLILRKIQKILYIKWLTKENIRFEKSLGLDSGLNDRLKDLNDMLERLERLYKEDMKK